MFELEAWAQRWGVSPAALAELRGVLVAPIPAPEPPDPRTSAEAYVQSMVRLEAARSGVMLWRNNVGALQDKVGRWVRYGLANDSEPLNRRLKSADLIGWRRVTITPEMVGRVLAQFVSRECKPGGWRYTGHDREEAQANWAALVNTDGGDAGFANGVGTLN